jgi:hypothetical protein
MNASEKQTAEKTAEGAAPKARGNKRRGRAAKAATKPINKPKSRNNGNRGARKGSKTAKILALLRRPAGASLAELRKVTGWQAHSVRGFLSGTLKKKMGLRIDSVSRSDGERVYRVNAK